MEAIRVNFDDGNMLKQTSDPLMNDFVADDFSLYQYLTEEREGQTLDETVDLDVRPQPSYPSPSYESEGIPSPSGMDGGMSPVSSGGDTDVMSELATVNFGDLLNESGISGFDGSFQFESLLPAEEEPKSDIEQTGRDDDAGTSVTAAELSDDPMSEGEFSPVSVTPEGNYNLRLREKPISIKVVPAGSLPSRSRIVGPKVVRVSKRKAAPELDTKVISVDGDSEIMMDKNNKNAVQARLNRQKKKAYVQSLEEQVNNLQTENERLKRDSSKITKEHDSLAEEVSYLKSILLNDSALSGLLQNIENVPNVRLSSSFTRQKRSASTEHDHDYDKPRKSRKLNQTESGKPGGICLHVNQNEVSLEFCAACAKKAHNV